MPSRSGRLSTPQRKAAGGVIGALGVTVALLADVQRCSAQDEIEVETSYVGDAFHNSAGGLRRGGTLLHNVDLMLSADGALVDAPWLGAFVYLLGNAGGSISKLAGDRQGASNIEAPSAVRLYEAWLQAELSDWSLLVGFYDLNGDFYVAETGTLFLNSAHGIGSEYAESGRNGPSIFPVTSLAARLRWMLDGPAYAQFAVLDAVPGVPDRAPFVHVGLGDGLLASFEAGISRDATPTGLHHKLAVGAWAYTSAFTDPVDPGVVHEGTHGAYLLADAELLREAGQLSQGLAGFARVGFAEEDVHPLTWNWGAGLVYTGPIPGRDEDQAGVAVTTAGLAPEYRRTEAIGGRPLDAREIAVEATYALRLAPGLLLQPDIQYIVNPGMNPTSDDALLWGVRIHLSWSGDIGGH